MRNFRGVVLRALIGTSAIALGSVAHAEVRKFNLVEQPATLGIREFSRQANRQLVASEKVVENKLTNKVVGNLEVDEALVRMIARTGLYVAMNDGRSIVLKAAPALTSHLVTARAVAEQPATDPTAVPSQTADVQTLNEEIIVTASRVQRDGYTAPTPTTVVGSDLYEKRGATNVAEVLQEIPSFKATQGPQTTGIIQRTPGANYVDLRGLGASRTLVLVDGRRFVPQISSFVGYQVDLNQVPALMVDRVEVVTGGASAQWGSDAVAGVVNIIPKKKFDGLNLEAQGGISQEGDNKSYRFGLLTGKTFADDRANITIGMEYERNRGVPGVDSRDWGRQHYQITANPCPGVAPVSTSCPAGGNGQASQLILPDIQFSVYAPGGVINNTVLRGTTFLADGTPTPFQYGQYVGSTNMVGGGQPGVNFSRFQAIIPQYRRFSSYGRLSYEISPALTAFVEGTFSYSRGGDLSTASRNTAYVIRADNPFIPNALAGTITTYNAGVAAPQRITSFNLGRANYDIGIARGDSRNETLRFVGGLEGRLAQAGNWKWDASINYGRNRFKLFVNDNLILANMTAAVDAVRDPVTNQIVCRSTLTGATPVPFAAAGCVPINLFGEGAPSQAAKDYVLGQLSANTLYEQFSATANVSGEPFSTWAGPVSVAFGVEYRKENQDSRVDPIAERAGYEGNNVRSVSGKFNVKEGYLEAVVPLAKDLPFARSLDLNGAVRYADYSTAAGGQTTWKLGATYEPVDGLLLRLGRSRDIRAANIYEQNIPGTVTQPGIIYGNIQASVRQVSAGNPNLKPEKADTWTVGGVLTPSFLPGFRFSLDYYRIDAKGIIASLSAQQIANYCLAGSQQYCDLITFSGLTPTAVQSPLLNLASVLVSGLDIQASYRLPLENIGATLPGVVTLTFSGNYALHAKVDTGVLNAPVIDRVGENGPGNVYSTARFRSTTSLNYDVGNLTLNAQVRTISGGKYDVAFTPTTINRNDIAAQAYLDLGMTAKISEQFEVFGVVNNALNNDPPPAPSSINYPTNPIYYDMVGRSFRFGVRYRM